MDRLMEQYSEKPDTKKPESESLWTPYLACPACGTICKEQFYIERSVFTTRFECEACNFDMLADEEGYPARDHRVEFINRLDITLFTLNEYVFHESHGDVLLGDPVGEIMMSLGGILQRKLGLEGGEE